MADKKHWTHEEKARIVQEADSPGGSFHAVATKYGLSPMTVYKWEKTVAERQRMLESVANVILTVMDEDEELIRVGVPESLYASGIVATVVLCVMLLNIGFLAFAYYSSNAQFLLVCAAWSCGLFAAVCVVAHMLYCYFVGVDLAITSKRMIIIRWSPLAWLIPGHVGGGHDTRRLQSYYFQDLERVVLEETGKGQGNLTLIAKSDGKQKSKELPKLLAVSDVRVFWDALPAGLKVNAGSDKPGPSKRRF